MEYIYVWPVVLYHTLGRRSRLGFGPGVVTGCDGAMGRMSWRLVVQCCRNPDGMIVNSQGHQPLGEE